MPRFVILLSADALIHASAFCCGNARAFRVLPKMRLTAAWQTQHGCAGYSPSFAAMRFALAA